MSEANATATPTATDSPQPHDWTPVVSGCVSGGSLTLQLVYCVSPSKRLASLAVLQQMGQMHPTVWLSRLAPFENAVCVAEELACDIEDYIDTLNLTTRPVEDMDLDDVIEHLRRRINNEFV